MSSICEICGDDFDVRRYKKEIALCRKHYDQIRRHGKTFETTMYDSNELIVYGDIFEIILRNKNQQVVGKTKVSISQLELVKQYKWYLSKNGYAYTSINNRRTPLHSVIIGLYKGLVVDHINRDKLDNRNENLRIVTQQLNCLNASTPKSNSSGFKGVSFDKKSGKWRSHIKINYKQINLGYYSDIQDAIRARVDAEKKYTNNLIEKYGGKSS